MNPENSTYPSPVIRGSNCPLCGSHDISCHLELTNAQIRRCQACHFMYSDPIPSSDQLASYYANSYGGERHKMGQQVNAAVNFQVLKSLGLLSTPRKVLDIGAGYGYLLKKLEGIQGVKAFGIEPSLEEARHAADQLRLKMITPGSSLAQSEKGSFDLVCSFEVIEHTTDPSSFLKEALSYLKPGGILVTMTDNFDSAPARALGASFPKWIPQEHLSHFSPTSMRALLRHQESLEIIGEFSFSPLDMHARNLAKLTNLDRIRSRKSLKRGSEVEHKVCDHYRFFKLRKLIGPLWTRLSLSSDMSGTLMYFICQRKKTFAN